MALDSAARNAATTWHAGLMCRPQKRLSRCTVGWGLACSQPISELHSRASRSTSDGSTGAVWARQLFGVFPMNIRSSDRTRGFTLIELLVVVAIIAVLISILLPSLSRAREQAKTIKSVANLSSIGKAMAMYITDNKEWFPFEKRNWPNNGGNPNPNGWVMTAFYYAGHPGRPTDGDQYSYTFDLPNLRDTF